MAEHPAFAKAILQERDRPRIEEIWKEGHRLEALLENVSTDKEKADIRGRMLVLRKEYDSIEESRERELRRLGHSHGRSIRP